MGKNMKKSLLSLLFVFGLACFSTNVSAVDDNIPIFYKTLKQNPDLKNQGEKLAEELRENPMLSGLLSQFLMSGKLNGKQQQKFNILMEKLAIANPGLYNFIQYFLSKLNPTSPWYKKFFRFFRNKKVQVGLVSIALVAAAVGAAYAGSGYFGDGDKTKTTNNYDVEYVCNKDGICRPSFDKEQENFWGIDGIFGVEPSAERIEKTPLKKDNYVYNEFGKDCLSQTWEQYAKLSPRAAWEEQQRCLSPNSTCPRGVEEGPQTWGQFIQSNPTEDLGETTAVDLCNDPSSDILPLIVCFAGELGKVWLEGVSLMFNAGVDICSIPNF
jgi:hypothetical protein